MGIRKIVFRGKRLDNKEWVYVYLADREYINNCLSSIKVSIDTIGEYTGLDDKNGKKIYEGDIVKTLFLDPTLNAPISFHNGAFMVDYYEGRHKIPLQDLHDIVEVIGNIYDNPELLEGGDK